jgi:hypothetical protein
MLAMEAPGQDFLPGVARGGGPAELGKVFIGGLSRETTTEGLRAHFAQFGDISDCVVMKDRSTGAPRGFGFVTYASQIVANRVVHHRHVVDGKEVEAKPAVPRDSDSLAPPLGARLPTALPGLAGQLGGGLPPPVPPGMPGALPGFAGGPFAAALTAQQPPMVTADDGGANACKKIFVGGLSHETSEADFVAYFGARRRRRRRISPLETHAHAHTTSARVCGPLLHPSCGHVHARASHREVVGQAHASRTAQHGGQT